MSEGGSYLGSVDARGDYFRWREEVSSAQVISNLRDRFGLKDIAALKGISLGARGRSGRVLDLTVTTLTQDREELEFAIKGQYDIRRLLHPTFLLSSAFVVDVTRDKDGLIHSISLDGCGWGHGVGMCQMGAVVMSLGGIKYREILAHYYPLAKIARCY